MGISYVPYDGWHVVFGQHTCKVELAAEYVVRRHNRSRMASMLGVQYAKNSTFCA